MDKPDIAWCMRCEKAPSRPNDLYCGRCREQIDEDGPSDAQMGYAGPYEPLGYRQDMIDAGRGHLLR
jgi:hypothetical protein